MPTTPSSQRAPTSAMLNRVYDYQRAIDWGQVRDTLAATRTNVDHLRNTYGMSYHELLCKSQVYQNSERPVRLQILLNDDQTMNDILRIVEHAADKVKNPLADPLTLMQWQLCYLLAKLDIVGIRYGLKPIDAGCRLATDSDFSNRINALVRCLKPEFVLNSIELEYFFSGMDQEQVYALHGPEPDITSTGTPLSAEALQARQKEVLLVGSLDENLNRDHRFQCALQAPPLPAPNTRTGRAYA